MIGDPILSLAVIFILSFFSARLIKKLKVPTITAYIALGIILSPALLDVVSPRLLDASEFFSNVVLGIIAFSLGGSFSLGIFRRVGKAVISISVASALCAWFLVTAGFSFFFGYPFYIALIFGAIATATDPASVVIITQEYRSKGDFTDTLLGIVAIDDAWALIIFSLSLSLAKSFFTSASGIDEVLRALGTSFFEIAGSFIIGGIIAAVFNKLAYFITSVKDRLIYTLGFLFFAIGLAHTFHCSILLTCMCFGALLANTNRMSGEFFGSLREIENPLYIIFFVLAGASLELNVLLTGGILTVTFIIVRVLGKYVGAVLGAACVKAPRVVKNYIGLALFPQAGVALACALVAKHTLGNSWGDLILTITIATTVVFELIGPSCTRYSLVKAGEIKE